MDKKDLMLLELLCENCRLSQNTLNQTLNLSKETIKNKIINFEKDKTITHYNTIVDLQPLGYLKFHILIKLIKTQNIEKDLEKIQKNQYISFINTFLGKYDLHIIIDVKNLSLGNKIVEEIIETFKENVYNYIIFNYIKTIKHQNKIPEFYNYIKYNKQLDTSFSSITPNYFKPKEKETLEKIDKLDIKILLLLSENPKISLVDISTKLNYNRETIKNRISNLINKNVIRFFAANVSFEKFGYITYFFLIKINNTNLKENIEKNIFQNTNIFYAAKIQGNYDYIIYILAKNPKELKQSIDKLKNSMNENILDMEIMIFENIIKYKSFPEGIIKDYIK